MSVTDPFILVHEGRFRPSELAGKDTRHPHRGFDNLWYVLQGSASTGHTTGPGGSIERARLSEGSLLWLRTGRGAWHAEAVGADERRRGPRRHRVPGRAVLGEPRPQGQAGRAARRTCCTETRSRYARRATRPFGSWSARAPRYTLGTPALILDVELPDGGQLTTPVPPEFQGFAYLLDGEAAFGANKRRARPPQLVLLGPGEELTVTDAAPGTRFMLMAGKPYGEAPVFNGPFVD